MNTPKVGSSASEPEQSESIEAASVVLPLVTALISVSVNPFVAGRLLSVLEAATSSSDIGDGWWSDLTLSHLFDAVEAHLRIRLAERNLTESPAYYSQQSSDWPLLQALLQINLLPFALTPNLQMLVEVRFVCNSLKYLLEVVF